MLSAHSDSLWTSVLWAFEKVRHNALWCYFRPLVCGLLAVRFREQIERFLPMIDVRLEFVVSIVIFADVVAVTLSCWCLILLKRRSEVCCHRRLSSQSIAS